SAFLIGGQSQNQVARGRPAFLLQAEKAGDQKGVALLHGTGGGSVKEDVTFIKLKGIEVRRPILRERLDKLQKGEKEDRFFFPVALSTQTHHKIVLVRQRTQHMDVFRGKSGRAKAGRHRLHGGGNVAHRCIGSVDLDELFIDVTRQLLGRRKRGFLG